MLYMNADKQVNLKSSYHKRNFFSSVLIVCLYEMMDVYQTYCDKFSWCM